MRGKKITNIITRHLFEITGDFTGLQNLLESGEISEEEIPDSLDAIDCEFPAKAHQVAIVIANISAPLDAIDHHIELLKAKKQAISNKADRLKHYLADSMEATGTKKVVGDIFTINLAAGSPRVIADVDALPDEFVRVKTTLTADKTAIKKAINEGVDVIGASIEIGPKSLRIK